MPEAGNSRQGGNDAPAQAKTVRSTVDISVVEEPRTLHDMRRLKSSNRTRPPTCAWESKWLRVTRRRVRRPQAVRAAAP